MRRALVGLVIALGSTAFARAEEMPRLAPQRIVFRTQAGDIVFALYPDVAPLHTEQILKLARSGIFDTTHFFRYEPGFILQLSTAQERSPQSPLTPDQKAMIHPIKAEFSRTLKHRRGTLSMAHYDNQPDSGETSFSIYLGDAPHVDGNYTIFGHVESGMDVVEELIKVPCDKTRPRRLLEVTKAEVADYPEALSRMNIAPAHPLPSMSESPSQQLTPDGKPDLTDWGGGALAGGVLLMMSVGIAGFLLSKRLSPRIILSLHLVTVLIGSFVLLMLLVPLARFYEIIGIGLFLGLLGLMKLMGRFESPA